MLLVRVDERSHQQHEHGDGHEHENAHDGGLALGSCVDQAAVHAPRPRASQAARALAGVLSTRGHHDGVHRGVDNDAQAKALRLRLYASCSECARLIDLVEGNRQQRDVERVDLLRHYAEEHKTWLEMLGITES
jgi:hypothetical protein